MRGCYFWIAGLLYIYIFYIFKCASSSKEKDLLKCHISISIFSCLCTATLMVQVQHWLLPREAYFSHMFPTFISSNGPICLSKCVCCVLFPARFVPMPSLQWALLSLGVRTEASRYLYRPNSWGPPSQRSVGWGEKLSWKVQVKPSVG